MSYLAFNWDAHGRNVITFAGVLVALGVIWRYAVRPPIRFARRIDSTMKYVEGQMRNNGGSSLLDKVEATASKVDILITRTNDIESRVEAQMRTDVLLGEIKDVLP